MFVGASETSMKLQQLQTLKRWHVLHRRDHPVEHFAWDMIVTIWLAGLIGEPASLILQQPAGVVGCIGLVLAPTLYVKARKQLHRSGRLRCDWLGAVAR